VGDIYIKLAKHMEKLVMGYPYTDEVLDLLKEMYSPVEAEVALAIPNDLPPLKVCDADIIVERCSLPEPTVKEILESLAMRNLIYSGTTSDGKPGYALLQVGYGMPQTFFWKGVQQDEHAKKMARLVLKYFSVPTTREVYGGVATKTYKYAPATLTVDVPLQGVYPYEKIDTLLEGVSKVAVAYCPCRTSARILARTDCRHSLEVCLKYDEMAEFVTSRGLAREISKDEARHILEESEKEGLVHMVDNVKGEIKHTCNCCGHYCWNVGIIRRKKVPRDVLMAVYFIRKTEEEECVGCGACEDICPVGAVEILDGVAKVDMDWCIGCGVCAVVCPTEAISIVRRTDKEPPENFLQLHQDIKVERGLG